MRAQTQVANQNQVRLRMRALVQPMCGELEQAADAIIEERKLMTGDMEKISLRTVDHAVWRVAQLVALTLVALLLAAVAGLFLVRRMFFRAPHSPGG